MQREPSVSDGGELPGLGSQLAQPYIGAGVAYLAGVDWTGDEHPAVAAVMAAFNKPDRPLSVIAFQLRGEVAAVIGVRRHISGRRGEAVTGYVPAIVKMAAGKWQVPSYVGGTGRPDGSERPRQLLSANPPLLMWDSTSTSWTPGTGGGPSVQWSVPMGRAAADARVLTVETAVDVQSSEVGEDGFVAVLFRSVAGDLPRLRVRTMGSEVVMLSRRSPS